MITLNELAETLTTVEMGAERTARWDDVANFDQTITVTDGGDTEITEADADAIREAWTEA